MTDTEDENRNPNDSIIFSLTVSQEEKSLHKAKFRAWVENVMENIDSDEDLYKASVVMRKTCEKINTNAKLTSAMVMFGTYSGIKPMPNLASNKNIGIQPTAKQRRILGGGRLSLKRRRDGNGAVSFPKRPAPLNIGYCSLQSVNIANGKTHSAK